MSGARSRAIWPALAVAGLGLLVAALAGCASWWLRQRFVEPSDVALLCNAVPHPGWCLIRFAILIGQHNALFGVAALIAGGLALFRGGRGSAIVAVGLSVAAMVNYNVEMGALALIGGLIGSLRLQSARRGDARRA
jgi:hypothetical protein